MNFINIIVWSCSIPLTALREFTASKQRFFILLKQTLYWAFCLLNLYAVSAFTGWKISALRQKFLSVYGNCFTSGLCKLQSGAAFGTWNSLHNGSNLSELVKLEHVWILVKFVFSSGRRKHVRMYVSKLSGVFA